MNNKDNINVFNDSFIQSVFPSFLSDIERLVLALSIQLLIDKSSADVKSIFSDELSVISAFVSSIIDNEKEEIKNNYLANFDSDISRLNLEALNVVKQVKSKLTNILRKHHACAFICSMLEKGDENKDLFELYKLLILLSSERLVKVGNHDSAIHDVINELRQLASGGRPDILPYLKKISDDDEFEKIIDKIYAEKTEGKVSEITESQLSHYHVIFNHAYYKIPGITRQGGQSVIKMTLSPNLDEEDDFETYKLKSEVKPNRKLTDNWLTEEENHSPEKMSTFLLYDKSNQDPTEKYQRQHKAKCSTDRVKMRNQSLPCDLKILTDYEIHELTSCLIDDLTNRTDEYVIATALIFCLLPDRLPAKVNGKKAYKKTKFIYDKEKKGWKLKIKHSVATKVQKSNVQHLITAVDDYLEWIVPGSISVLLPKKNSIPKLDDIKKYLKSINKKLSTRLDISKITNYFSDFCHQQGIDGVLTEVVRGVDNYQDEGTPYTNMNELQIDEVLHQYCDHIFPELNLQLELTKKTQNNRNRCIGSPLLLQQEEITLVNFMHIQQINQLKQHQKRNLVLLHNQYVFYIYRMITMATGYRPVTGVGGTLKDINFISSQFWISDKESRDQTSARLIVLPTIVIQQLKAYLAYLKELKYLVKINMPNISGRIDGILSSDEHILFFIEDNNEIVEISPTSIQPYMDVLFKLPLNWHRHDLRSRLVPLELPAALKSYYMGHDEMGQEGLGRYSGLSYCDLKKIAEKVETILYKHKFEVVNII